LRPGASSLASDFTSVNRAAHLSVAVHARAAEIAYRGEATFKIFASKLSI
jgi:hypothetical protein